MTNSKKLVRTKNSSSSTSNLEPRTSAGGFKTRPYRKTLNSPLPLSFRKYFWDCPFDDLYLEKYPRFIAARILNFGDWEAVTWLFARGGRELVNKAVKNGRYVNNKTENFWKMMLHG